MTSIISAAGKLTFEFFLPGNHDLDFVSEPDTRPALLKSVQEKSGKIDLKGETARQILRVQQNFFEFEALMLKSTPIPSHDRLAYSRVFQFDDHKIQVNCFNTAWTSTNPEVPGQLVFPIEEINLPSDATDLVISAFHHPYNWLEPDNARRLRRFVESTSDVILTGHEHESEIFVKSNSDSVVAQYVEGAVLQEGSKGRSAFNVVVIDTSESTYEAFLCQWTGELYDQSSSGAHQFVRNKLACRANFRNNRDFQHFLSDPGLPILHPHKRDVRHEDLYIYPAVACKNPEKKFEIFKIIDSQNVLEYVRSNSRLLIVGDETSGKTSLAKKLCSDLQIDGDLVSLLVSGENFDGY